MGKKLIAREDDPVLHDLGRWMDFLGLHYKDMAKEWGVSRVPVWKRLGGRQSLEIENLRKALGLLGLSAAEFYHGVETGFHPELLLDDVAKEDGDQVTKFRQRHLEGSPRRAYAAEELREMAAGLEALRFRDPETAHDQAREILRTPELEPDVAAEAWGVMGVLQRFKGRPSITAFCLGKALRIGGSEVVEARNYQRFAMLLLYHVADAGLALEATLKARDLYWACGDVAGMGKTMVDWGLILVNGTGDYRRALAVCEAALELLPEESVVNRFCALQGLAVACVYLGDVPQALERLDEALAVVVVDHAGVFLASIIFWLKGEIALLLGRYQEALRHFGSVKARYVDLGMGAVEIALISLRIAKAHFLNGDRKQVRATLENILFTVGDVQRSNRVLGSALGEFLREKTRGRISAEALEAIYRRMRGGSETAPPLLPVKLPAGG